MTTARTVVGRVIGGDLQAIVLLAVIAAALTACGGSGGGGGSPPPPAPTPSTAASRWEVTLATNQTPACLRPGAPLALSVAAFTSAGTPITAPRYEITSNVAGALEADGAGGWRVRGEGAARVTVTYTGETAPSATIAPVAFDVLRDSQPPEIAVHQPSRGAMVTAAGDARVQGAITDATSPLRSVTVNGVEQLAAPVPEHTIDVTPPGRWGLNVVEVVATDDCGNAATLSQSYLRSSEYRPAATAASTPARVARGQAFRLTSQAFDDGNRNDVDDIVTLADRYIGHTLGDLVADSTAGMLVSSDPATNCPDVGYRLAIAPQGVSLVAPHVNSIQLRAGGTQQAVSIQRITVPLRFEQITQVGIPLTGCLESRVPFSATIQATVSSTSTSTATVMNGRVEVTIPTITVQLTDVAVVLTGVAVVDNILSSLVSIAQDAVEDTIAEVLRAELPPLLEVVLNTPLLVNGSIAAGPSAVPLTAHAGIDSITATPTAAAATAYTQVRPTSVGTPHVALGAIARPTAAPDLSSSTAAVTYAIDDNLINQGLWALWYGGALEITDAIGVPGIALEVSALLPPVLMPSTQPGSIAFGMGDLQVALRLGHVPGAESSVSGPVTVDAYVSYLLDGTIGYQAASRTLRLTQQDDRAYVHVVRARDDDGDVTDPEARAHIAEYAEPLIAGSIEQLAREMFASTPLPPRRVEFSSGAVDAIEMQITGVTRMADHVAIDMRMTAEIPPAPSGYLTLNNPWTTQDLIDKGVPPAYWNSTIHVEYENPTIAVSRSTTINNYELTTRPACEAAGLSNGLARCLPEFEEPLNYGWYCGAGRPVVGWTAENPVLDPLDYCCVLHDAQVWTDAIGVELPDPLQDPAGHLDGQVRNACGAAMCMGALTYSSPDLAGALPDFERARQILHDRAMLVCRVRPPGNLP